MTMQAIRLRSAAVGELPILDASESLDSRY